MMTCLQCRRTQRMDWSGARRGVVSEVWTFNVRSRMGHTYAYLFRLRANAKTALFRATPLLFDFLFFFMGSGSCGWDCKGFS